VKKLLVLALAAFVSIPSFAQSLSVSSEVKTGLIWERVEDRRKEADSVVTGIRMGSMDDAGSLDGRFRVDLVYTNADGNVGFKTRFNWEEFTNRETGFGPFWTYGFAWGSFFNDQLALSLGKLGASPWSSGGPYMWRELELAPTGGLRVEWKPSFIPGELNVGFVLNWINTGLTDAGLGTGTEAASFSLEDVLSESVIGMSYKNDWFMVRAAYRFDSEADFDRAIGTDPFREGGSLVYRVEEYALQRWVSGLSLYALGEFDGIGSEKPDINFFTRNWVFIQYAPPAFTAELQLGLEILPLGLEAVNLGFEAYYTQKIVLIRPSFFYNLFDGLISPGIIIGYANDFGNAKKVPGSAYSYFEFEPTVQANLAPGAYISLSYYWRMENQFNPLLYPPEQQTQWINLRAGITF